MAKFNDIRELAQQNARWVSNSPKDWMNYLDVAARLYRYSFKDTLLIHAQRPDATACAELEVWNKKMNRWVNRGAKGIALLDDASPRAKLRYVFDIADTHLVQGGRTPILWRIDDSEHQQMILDHLADTYDSESVGKVWRIIGWKKWYKKKNTRLGERIQENLLDQAGISFHRNVVY